ncbi:PadR family transcriptional regulator [Herbaspirillum sp. meg3]|uniref:winged helix-turn-helix transcriptional regulator n=1 Tax=Herbaspirillum sp. meg3 TaxID=2025949 RepID=UPI000B990664|nr:helix-turn-helix domain-containing protein [Herbaspirillum sp. meg3]ASU39301.1 PadR family transcriptional regulator [Herbaspirillum sp. meg3]
MKPANKISAEETQTDIYRLACPSRKALELVGSKWALLIFPALAAGPMRNNALLRKIEGISQKMLTQTLKELERNGLVTRCNLETAAPHVEYELSPLGESLSETLIALDNWAERHYADLQRAREQFDSDEKAGEAVTGRIVHKLK